MSKGRGERACLWHGAVHWCDWGVDAYFWLCYGRGPIWNLRLLVICFMAWQSASLVLYTWLKANKY